MRLLVNEEREPRLLAYLAGCVLGNLLAFAVNSFWLEWPITWALFVPASLLALWGVFSIETVVEGCVVCAIAAVPLVIVLWLKPDYHIFKQFWLAAVAGLFAGKIWVGLIR